MRNKTMVSIYPNTLGFGYVALNEKGEIIDYGMISVRPIRNNKCLDKIRDMILYYEPNILILEDYMNSNKSERIKKLIKSISIENDNLKVFRYSIEQIKNTFEIFGAKNKYEISKKIVEAYPQLETRRPNKRKVWEPANYYQGIFDALALVLTHQYIND